MLAQLFSLLTLAVSATLAAPTAPTSLDQRAVARRSLSGQATFYGGNVHGGTCSFSTYTLPSGLYGTALSDSNWDDAGNCGGCVAVTYGGKTVTAMVRLILGCLFRRGLPVDGLSRSSTSVPAAARTISISSLQLSLRSPARARASSM